MAKIKNVAVQMDHVSGISIAGDSTFAMSLEAQARGYKLFHYTPDKLTMRDGRIYASVEPMILRDVKGDHFELGEAERVCVSLCYGAGLSHSEAAEALNLPDLDLAIR